MQIISVNGIRIVPQEMLAAGVQKVLAVNPDSRVPDRMLLFFIFPERKDLLI